MSSKLALGLNRVERIVEVHGTVMAEPDDDGTRLGTVTLPLVLMSDSDGVALTLPAGPTGLDGGLLVSYRDSDEYVHSAPYEVEWVYGDGDSILEYGELALLTVSLRGGVATTPAADRWTLELVYGPGGLLTVSRRLPALLQPMMPLP